MDLRVDTNIHTYKVALTFFPKILFNKCCALESRNCNVLPILSVEILRFREIA